MESPEISKSSNDASPLYTMKPMPPEPIDAPQPATIGSLSSIWDGDSVPVFNGFDGRCQGVPDAWIKDADMMVKAEVISAVNPKPRDVGVRVDVEIMPSGLINVGV